MPGSASEKISEIKLICESFGQEKILEKVLSMNCHEAFCKACAEGRIEDLNVLLSLAPYQKVNFLKNALNTFHGASYSSCGEGPAAFFTKQNHDRMGHKALFAACRGGHLGIVQCLLNLAPYKENSGFLSITVLVQAITETEKSKSLEIYEALNERMTKLHGRGLVQNWAWELKCSQPHTITSTS